MADVSTESDRVESVTDFTRRLKGVLESGLGRVWVRGEVSNLRVQASGHSYFSLKDAGAQLACVLFRGDATRQSARLRDGSQFMVFGDVSVYETRGQYQLIVRAVVDDGEGRLQRAFEALKQRLAAEGLFDRERKRPLPSLPRVVGIVTSPTGAALQDFKRIMLRRGWRGRLVVFPVRVQGEGAAAEIAAAIELASSLVKGAGRRLLVSATKTNKTCPAPVLDVVVVGRGGGSLEDLWAFNEEEVVRAIAGSAVPVISAVGHEIDFTLSDFAADVRAETPSGAAELLSSRYREAIEQLERLAETLATRTREVVAAQREEVEGLRSRLRLLSPQRRVEQGWQRRDDFAARLAVAFRGNVRAKRAAHAAMHAAVMARSPSRRVEIASQQLLALWKRLQSASPASVLQRGFVILRDPAGRPITRRAGLTAGDPIRAQFHDGEASARIDPA